MLRSPCRVSISHKLMDSGCGNNLVSALTKSMSKTVYHPKISKNRLGTGIDSKIGMTQGRKTSANLFSFYLSDMSKAFENSQYSDFMQPVDFGQLADDTMIYADRDSLLSKCPEIISYSDGKYQVINMKKTKYCEFIEDPKMEDMMINDTQSIGCVTLKDGYPYLGFKFIPTNNVTKIIERNVNDKMYNVSKYYGWLDIMFNAMLYGSETWGDFSNVHEKVRAIERKLLKRILGVKSGTTNDLIYHELRRGDIVSRIKHKQCRFIANYCRCQLMKQLSVIFLK